MKTASKGAQGHKPTILLVDDQADVLISLQMTVKLRGYNTLAASSGPEAIRLVSENPGTIDVVVTDYAMPEMNGRELIRHLQEMDPTLQFIAISGHATPEEVASLVALGVVAFLPKPFSLNDLHSAIEQALILRQQSKGATAVSTRA